MLKTDTKISPGWHSRTMRWHCGATPPLAGRPSFSLAFPDKQIGCLSHVESHTPPAPCSNGNNNQNDWTSRFFCHPSSHHGTKKKQKAMLRGIDKMVKPDTCFQSQGHVKQNLTVHDYCLVGCRDISTLKCFPLSNRHCDLVRSR